MQELLSGLTQEVNWKKEKVYLSSVGEKRLWQRRRGRRRRTVTSQKRRADPKVNIWEETMSGEHTRRGASTSKGLRIGNEHTGKGNSLSIAPGARKR